MYKMLFATMLLASGCSMEATHESETGSTEQAVQHLNLVTRIRVNGASATAFLADSAGTNGFLTVTQDQVANTTALDFSYATPDPMNPDLAILFQGAGEIPNSAFTQTTSSAQLTLTTAASYTITRCVVNLNTAEFTCAPSTPLAFNLTWAQNGFGSVHEVTRRTETFGPVTTKVNAEFTSVTATVNGTYGGRTAQSIGGDLTNSESKSYIREITLAY